MSSIPLPALNIQKPEDPLAQYAKVMQVKSMMQQQQAQAQQQQMGQIQLQQAQQQQQDYKTLMDTLRSTGGDMGKALPILAQSVSYPTYAGAMKNYLDTREKYATINDKELTVAKDKADRLAGLVGQAQQMPPDVYQQQWPQIAEAAIQIRPELAQKVNPSQPTPQDRLGDFGIGILTEDHYIKSEQNKRAGAESAAKLPGEQATSAIAQNKLKMIQSANPADYANLVDQVIPATGANSALNHRTKTLVNFAISRGDLDGAQKALTEATNQVGAIEKETSPAVINARVGQAVATEVGKARALAPPLQTIMRTSISGGKYISAEDATGESGNYIRQQAAQAGIPVVSKDTAETLSDIDTARANQNYMLGVIGKKLASDPTGRLYTAPKNTLEKLAQTDPDMAAVGTFRNAAIQSMRAVAGGKGLRINQYEVQLAIENDIPKLTDTLPTAQAKLKNLQNFLGNTEQSHLLHNRTQMTNAPAPGQPGGQPAAAHPFFKKFGGAAVGETNPQ